MRVLISIVLGAATLAGCERSGDEALSGAADGRLVTDSVARVGERAIGAAEVTAVMASEELGAEAALQTLIDQELLAQEAERLGFTVQREGERMIERRMVRAMLHDMEREFSPESISDEELREDYALYEDRFRIPERRRSWHILVKDPGEEAESLAASILRALRQAEDPRTVYERYAEGSPEDTNLEVLAEDLPPITEKAGIEKAYKDALFGAKSKGPLNKLVQTRYGWHAIVLAEVLPAEQRSMAEVEEDSRVRISQTKRSAALVQMVQALKSEGLARYDEQGVERLLSMAGLPKRTD